MGRDFGGLMPPCLSRRMRGMMGKARRTRMNRLRIGGMAVAFGLALASARTAFPAEDAGAGDLLRQAYLAVVDAELAAKEGRRADALREYRRAAEFLGRVQGEYPGWQADAIDYRLADCRNRMAALDKPAMVVEPELESAAETNGTDRLARLVDELHAVRAALGTDPDAANSSREWDRLRDERDTALRNVQALQRKLDRLAKDSARRGKEPAKPAAVTNAPLPLVLGTVEAEVRRLMQAGSVDVALRLLREAETLAPGDVDLAVLHGLVACRGGRFEEAVTVLLPLDTPEQQQAPVLVTLGSAYMGLGRIGEARIAMEKAVKLDPRSAEAHYNLAQILLAIKPPDPDRAEAHYSRAILLGSRPDPALENALRTAIVVARMKSRPRDTSTPVRKAPEVVPAPGATRKP